MTIGDIAHKLESMASENKFAISRLQLYRKEYYGRVGNKSIFSQKSIVSKGNYAFHAGGRKELQFNIGVEQWNKGEIFRFGVAISLERSRSLHRLMSDLKPIREGLNQFIRGNRDFFNGYSMWYHKKNGWGGFNEKVKPISDQQYKDGHFIFIGKYIEKPLDKLTDDDLRYVLITLDHLFPLYKHVVLDLAYTKIEDKLSRICWNDYGWVRPSGRHGKSTNKASHEGLHGFGHEEWLFDIEKIIDGYHYGFLEPINKHYSKYIGHTFNISLYALNGDEGKYYWVGRLNNVRVIDREEIESVIAKYKTNRWWKNMKDDLNSEGLDGSRFEIDEVPESYFNIKFKPEEIENILDEPYPIEDKSLIRAYRYTLYNFDSKLTKGLLESYNSPFNFNSGSDTVTGLKKKTKKHPRGEPKELELEHNIMIEKFFEYLKKTYPKEEIRMECKAYGRSRVDVVRKTPKGYIFYEIKTYNFPRISIRNAIGQLLEYAFYPDTENAIKLTIVTPKNANEKTENYIRKLNTILSIPMSYIHFDYKGMKLIKELD